MRDWFINGFLPPVVNGQEDLSNWSDQDNEDYLNIARLIVRHDMMQELVEELKGSLSSLLADVNKSNANANNLQTHDIALKNQELYDLFSVAIIGLEKEIFKYRKLIEQRYKSKTGASRGRLSGT